MILLQAQRNRAPELSAATQNVALWLLGSAGCPDVLLASYFRLVDEKSRPFRATC